MFHENAFQTGKILDKGETEVGVHLPLNATVAHGFLESGFEFRGFAGYSGWNTAGIGIAMGKAITKGDLFFSSGTADAELFFNTGHNFAGMRFTGTYALGWYPIDQFGLYVPLKVGFLFYDLDGAKGNGFFFVPGLGLSFEIPKDDKTAVFRIGVNYPFPELIDANVLQFPYIAVQVLFRW